MPLAVAVVDYDSAHNAEAGLSDGSFLNGIVAGVIPPDPSSS
jgi:hypothetical protein